MKVLCIYHGRDLDGWASGAIVKRWCEERKYDLELVGWDYGQDIPLDKIATEEGSPLHDIIFICDVSFPKEVMNDIYDPYNGINMVWCDHHKSALDDAKGMDYENCDGIRNTGLAGCELTWQYCYPDVDIPDGVELLGRYDTFRYKEDEDADNVIHFQYAARAYISGVDDFFKLPKLQKDDFFSHFDYIDEWLDAGSIILDYVKRDARDVYKTRKFDVNLDDYKAVCIPKERFNPVNYDIDYHEQGYDIAMCFWYKPSVNLWEFSIYNDNGKVDCAEIAKKMGGGGHYSAAGFTVEDINTIIKPNDQ